MPEVCVNGALPILLPGLPETTVDGVVHTLTGPSFRVGHSDVLGVVSYDLTGAAFDAQRYWRGPTWLNTTWLVARGLKTHGRGELAGPEWFGIVAMRTERPCARAEAPMPRPPGHSPATVPRRVRGSDRAPLERA